MRMHRVGAFMTYAANGGKESIERFWPLKSDQKTNIKMNHTVDEALWEQIKKSHNIV